MSSPQITRMLGRAASAIAVLPSSWPATTLAPRTHPGQRWSPRPPGGDRVRVGHGTFVRRRDGLHSTAMWERFTRDMSSREPHRPAEEHMSTSLPPLTQPHDRGRGGPPGGGGEPPRSPRGWPGRRHLAVLMTGTALLGGGATAALLAATGNLD